MKDLSVNAIPHHFPPTPVYIFSLPPFRMLIFLLYANTDIVEYEDIVGQGIYENQETVEETERQAQEKCPTNGAVYENPYYIKVQDSANKSSVSLQHALVCQCVRFDHYYREACTGIVKVIIIPRML